MPTCVAEVVRISHGFGDTEVLDDVSSRFYEGTTGLVGVNGAGKTTLFNILAGLIVAREGRADVFTAEGAVAHGPARASAIGVMPQSFVPPSSMTADEFLTYIAWLKGIRRSQRSVVVDEALEQVDLVEKRRSLVTALSGGMQRRLLLAQALLGDARLLLLDEPTAGLDPEQRVKQREVLRAVSGRAGAIVISSHLIEDLVQVSDRLLVLDDRRIAFDGTPADLLAIGQGLVVEGSGVSPYEAAFLQIRSRRA